MSEGEIFAAVVSIVVALFTWAMWIYRFAGVKVRHRVARLRTLVLVTPIFCGAIFVLLLRLFASFDVQEDVTYTFFYIAMGAAWVGVGALVMPFMGFCPRHDLIELGNRAVTPLVIGSLLAFTLVFAGGNFGDGPGWWVVVFASGVASIALVVAWLLFDGLAALTESATIDRDLGAGVRGGALLVSFGLIFGRGAAGDWFSFEDTVLVFWETTWPALVLLVGAALTERVLAKFRHLPLKFSGFVPSSIFVTAALGTVAWMGHW
jgi:hypothetical protein